MKKCTRLFHLLRSSILVTALVTVVILVAASVVVVLTSEEVSFTVMKTAMWMRTVTTPKNTFKVQIMLKAFFSASADDRLTQYIAPLMNRKYLRGRQAHVYGSENSSNIYS